jgi:hypothetical protein
MAKRVTFLAVVVISLAVSGCTKNEAVKNVCPIDGQSPEWVGQKNGKSCEFFHYSAIERHPHSWWADCQQSGVEQSKPLPNGPPSIQPSR